MVGELYLGRTPTNADHVFEHPQAGGRGLSVEEKRVKLLEIFHETVGITVRDKSNLN